MERSRATLSSHAFRRYSSSPVLVGVVGGYLLFGLVWIWVSDYLLVYEGIQSERGFWAAAAKGTVYVGLSGLFIAVLLRRQLRTVTELVDLLGSVVRDTTTAVCVRQTAGKYIQFDAKGNLRLQPEPADLLGRSEANVCALLDGPREVQQFRNLQNGLADSAAIDEEVCRQCQRTYRMTRAALHGAEREVIGIISIARDISEICESREALQLHDQRWRFFLEHSGVPIAMLDREMRYIFASSKWMTDFKLGEQQLEGRSHYEIFPEIPDRWKEVHARCLGGATERCEEDPFERPDGSVQWLRWEIRPWYDAAGDVGGLLLFSEDISERKYEAERLALQRSILELLAAGAPLQTVLAKIVSLIEAQIRGSACSIYARDHARAHLVLKSFGSLPPVFVKAASDIVIREGNGSCGTAAQRGEPVFVTDVFSDPLFAEYKELLRGSELRASWSFPIFGSTDGESSPGGPRLLGTFAIYNRKSRAPTEYEIDIIVQAAHLAGIAIERAEIERSLMASEERFRIIAESIEEVFWMSTPNRDRILYVSPAYERVWGRPIAPLYSDASIYFDAIHPDDRAAIQAGISQRTQGTYKIQYRILLPDGGARWIEERGYPVHDASGGITHIASSARDVTEQYFQEERSRRVLEVLPSAVFVNTNGKISFCNRAFCELVGCSEAEILGRSPFDFIAESFHAIAQARIAKLRGTEVSAPGVEYEFRRFDGSTVHVYSVAAAIPIAEGYSILVGATDLTKRLELEAQLRQSQKMEAVGRLAGGIAHDFNNLLTVINGYGDLILMRSATEPDLREKISAIRTAGRQAADLTAQLLAFSRRSIVEPKVLDVAEIVRDSQRLLTRVIGEGIRVSVYEDEQPCRIRADRGQIEQAILNLAVNARDAMRHGGQLSLSISQVAIAQPLQTSTGELSPGRYVVLEMSDTGCGMSDEVRGKIFEPFYTTKPVGEGTGLGLSVVYGAVEQSHGHIAVESSVGRGTTFRLYFPQIDEPASAQPAAEAEVPSGNETVLLVEDATDVRRLARISLEAYGYTVLEASSGGQALEVWNQHREKIRLLVTDVVMPGMNGRQLSEALRAVQPNLPVLFLSGYTEDLAVRLGVETLRESFLRKPYTPDALALKVREVLDSPTKAIATAKTAAN